MHFYFIGVTTSQSAMAKIFPLWAEALNCELEFVGIDLPLDASALHYREAAQRIKDDPLAIGSVVTTHKTRLYEHAYSLFDEFDALSAVTKEVCSITKQENIMKGMAGTDCLSTTLGLKDILDDDYWLNRSADLICLGAGGVARSLALSLLCDFQASSPLSTLKKYLPNRIVFVDIHRQQLESIKELLEPFLRRTSFEFLHQSDPAANDRLVEEAAQGSLIINATGMGKDRPGSPLTPAVVYPEQSIAWDLNYRGERKFLKQAVSQDKRLHVTVHDGWMCFMHGWTQSLQASLGQQFSRETFQMLLSIAEQFPAQLEIYDSRHIFCTE